MPRVDNQRFKQEGGRCEQKCQWRSLKLSLSPEDDYDTKMTTHLFIISCIIENVILLLFE